MWELLVWLFWYVGVPMGLAYLGGRLMAPDEPDEQETPESLQSTQWNPHTTQQEGLPRPRAYGKNMHYGNIVAKWTKASSGRERLYIILEHGDGPTKGIGEGTVYINDQPSGKFSGVTVYERKGTMNQTALPGTFEKLRCEYVQNTELKEDDSIYFTTPNDNFDDLEFTICFPNGLFYYHSDGDKRNGMAHIEVHIREYPGGGWTKIIDEHIEHFTLDPRYYSYTVSSLGYNCVRGKQYQLKFRRTDKHDVLEKYSGSCRYTIHTPRQSTCWYQCCCNHTVEREN